MPPNRNFFPSSDQDAIHPSEQQRLSHHSRQSSSHAPYHDSPTSSPAYPPSSFPGQHINTGYSPTSRRYHPSAHPDSHFDLGQRTRISDFDGESHRHIPPSKSTNYHHQPDSPTQSPPPPPHRLSQVGNPPDQRFAEHNLDQDHLQSTRSGSALAAGTDRFGDRRWSRRSVDQERMGSTNTHLTDGFQRDSPWIPSDSSYPTQRSGDAHQHLRQQDSYSSSTVPIAAGATTPGSMTPVIPASEASRYSLPLHDHPSRQMYGVTSPFHDSPYQSSSLSFDRNVGNTEINPQNIADDDDDGFMPQPKRKSVLSRTGPSHPNVDSASSARSGARSGAGAGASGGAATGGIIGALTGLAGRKQKGQTSSAGYDRVTQAGKAEGGGGEDLAKVERSASLTRQTDRKKRMRKIFVLAIGLLVVLAIIGAVLGGVLGSRSSSDAKSGSGKASPAGDSINNAEDDLAANGDLGKDSAEIKALMDNPDLHKVFPAMDYTPWGVQYPDCLTYPPSQNNITRDMAVLSQLSNVVRLYGTDCNQTEMVLHSIDRLGLSSMKLWLGVWIDITNDTTNDRQLERMYRILEDTPDHDIFKGVIVGNEALYRADSKDDEAKARRHLVETMTNVRSNLTSLKYDLPVTTSDLGDNWDAELVRAVDVIMSNIHPFFAGVTVDKAAGWTWDFWRNKNTPLVRGTDIPEIISETGWPSGGGNECGDAKCATEESGAVAGVDEMNIFMDDFVCQAMENKTDYFWFEAFDEPWKVSFNEAGKEWEDKWGLMDAARKLKPGLKIPDCGGKTVS